MKQKRRRAVKYEATQQGSNFRPFCKIVICIHSASNHAPKSIIRQITRLAKQEKRNENAQKVAKDYPGLKENKFIFVKKMTTSTATHTIPIFQNTRIKNCRKLSREKARIKPPKTSTRFRVNRYLAPFQYTCPDSEDPRTRNKQGPFAKRASARRLEYRKPKFEKCRSRESVPIGVLRKGQTPLPCWL